MNNYQPNRGCNQKISFKGLKADSSFGTTSCFQNKENQLSFQNLKRQENSQKLLKSNLSKKGKIDARQTSWINQTPDYFKNESNNIQQYFGSYPSNDQITSYHTANNKLVSRKSLKFEQIFHKQQQTIRNYIDSYNNKFNQILEILTDMQIKDLMKLNVILQKNQKIYKSWSFEEKIPNLSTIPREEIEKLNFVQSYLKRLINKETSSIDFQSTVDSKPNKRIQASSNSSTVSPRLSIKEKSQNIKLIEAKENNLQDTPESIKSKLSGMSSKIKATKNTKIGMFDRINICESIEEGLVPIVISLKQKERKTNRYGSNSEQ